MLSDLVHVAVPHSSCGWQQMTARARTGRPFSGRRNGPFQCNRVISMGRDKGLLSTQFGREPLFPAWMVSRSGVRRDCRLKRRNEGWGSRSEFRLSERSERREIVEKIHHGGAEQFLLLPP
jgi:hypothetical protein